MPIFRTVSHDFSGPLLKGRARRLLVAGLGVALLALSGCMVRNASAPATPRHVDTHELFAEGYERISHYYIEPVSAEKLGLAGLAKLSSVDSALTVLPEGNQVVMVREGVTIGRFDAPPANDNWGWGGVTAAVLDTARKASPRLAAGDEDALDKAVFEGAIGTLDRFSHYSTPGAARERRAERNGFDGIGVTLDAEEAEVRVLQVLPDGPAEHAGVKPNDRIISIDGTPASSLTREQVVARLRGRAGSVVNIGIERAGAPRPIMLAISRARIVLPTVVMTHDDRIINIRITSFNQETSFQLAESLAKARKEMQKPPGGIILDLRDNPGGLLDQSVGVANQFVPGGLVVSTTGRLPESRKQFYAEPTHQTDGIPMAVIVNGGSASASEIVAAALQDTGRAFVVGTSSFGKGTVQTVLELVNDGELTVTWARLVTPEGYVLHEHGVVPTVCTADVNDDDTSLTRAIERGTALGTGLASRPRSTLDEQGWRDLRQACPAQRIDRAADVKIAERILRDPTLYARALAVTPTMIARTAEIHNSR